MTAEEARIKGAAGLAKRFGKTVEEILAIGERRNRLKQAKVRDNRRNGRS